MRKDEKRELAEIQAELQQMARPRDNCGRLSAFRDTASALYFLGRAEYTLRMIHMIKDPETVATALSDAILQIGHAKDLLNLPPEELELDDDDFEIEFEAGEPMTAGEFDDLSPQEKRSHHVE